MNRIIIAGVAIVISMGSTQIFAEFGEACPRTVGSDRLLGAPFPDSETWYGSEALAVILPPDGTWPTTGPKAAIAVKLFWWSAGFEVGMESNLKVRIEDLYGGPENARVSEPTNAIGDLIPAMLVGVDIPGPGCWEVTGEFFGQTLSFVVESPPDDSNSADAG